tara:strand:+ start:468 stop:656 length:189 start_codon:yes stop_codon:yes gene_type:complete
MTKTIFQKSEHVYKKILLIEKYVPSISGVEAEAELSAELSRQLSESINREMLRELFNMVEDE